VACDEVMEYTFHTDPFKHQLKAVRRSLSQGSIGLLMDPGVGKTKPTIDYAGCLHLKEGINKVLVVMPKSVMGVWVEEISTHLPPEIERIIVRLDGSRRLKLIGQHGKPSVLTFFLISYDSLWRKTTKQALIRWKPELMICDESHYIANPTSKRSRGILAVGKVTKYRMILTGTFLPNGPLNSYCQLKFLYPTIFPMSWTKFKERYAVWYRVNSSYKKLKRYKRLKELNAIINQCCMMVTKQDAGLDLPDRMEVIVPVEMSAKGWKAYKTMKRDKIVELKGMESSAEIILTELLRFQQITSGFLTVETGEYDHRDRPIKEDVDIHDDKVRALLELVQIHRAYSEKVLIFYKFKWEYKAITSALKRARITFEGINGSTKNTRRDAIRREFQSGIYDALVLQIKAGGVGLTLTAANINIFYSTSQQLADYLQARDRIHRPGQLRKVTDYHLIVRNTIDEKIYQSHKDKKSLADRVTAKNWKEFV
jgi:SNF2 family DNA or RNA helicase